MSNLKESRKHVCVKPFGRSLARVELECHVEGHNRVETGHVRSLIDSQPGVLSEKILRIFNPVEIYKLTEILVGQ